MCILTRPKRFCFLKNKTNRFCFLKNKTKTGVDKMAQKVKTLMTKPDDLSSIPGSHMIEEGNQ